MPRPLPISFYERPVDEVARDLLGHILIRRDGAGILASGIIMEAEAYFGPDDPASHAYRRTPRSEIMYGPPGVLYVYFTYGMHFCANVVAHEKGKAGAVLLRALEPVEGIEAMAHRRGGAALRKDGSVNPRALCSGPAKLCQALAIGRADNGADLQGPAIWVEEGRGRIPDEEVAVTPRIGIRVATDRTARFVVADSPHRSR